MHRRTAKFQHGSNCPCSVWRQRYHLLDSYIYHFYITVFWVFFFF